MSMHNDSGVSVRRTAAVLDEPVSTVGRWVGPKPSAKQSRRARPVSGDADLIKKVKDLCEQDRHQDHGHRRIRALLRRRHGIRASRKTVLGIMQDQGLTQKRVRYKPARPKHVEKMRPQAPNVGWQVDMTSFVLSDLSPLYLVTVVDCFTRKIVGWTLDRRCRAAEWIAAVRMGLEGQGLTDKQSCAGLTLRSDNGAQPCSKRFVEFLAQAGVRGQYTGYNAPDDNAFVERVIRTIKEEEIWTNSFDSWSEAHAAIESYVSYYNNERIHSALDYQTPAEVEAAYFALKAA
jgi:putative transposase